LASTIVFSKPAEFKYPASISAGAMITAGVLYAVFVRQRRGHLVHLSDCMKGKHETEQSWVELAQHDSP